MLRFAELFTALVIVVTVVGCQEIVLAPRASEPDVPRVPWNLASATESLVE